MMPPAGYFRHRVELLRPVEAQSASGAVKTAWDSQEWRLADVVPKASMEYERQAQMVEQATAVYRIRGHVDVTLRHRIRHLDLVYEIKNIETESNLPTLQANMVVLTVKGPV